MSSKKVIKTYSMNNSSVLKINSLRKFINVEPEYQRNGDVWDIEKRQLLIDSILNEYDIPKIYFHSLSDDERFKYAIIDGRQRLETIWKFIDGEFSLAEDFEYYKNEQIKAGGLIYKDLANEYLDLKIDFDSFVLPIVVVETDDIELIEDMFSRLNEAVPLNAAEKRVALGGPMTKLINRISNHVFFTEKLKVSNKRYQHKEIAAKLLFLEYRQKIVELKKPLLDGFVKTFKKERTEKVQPIGQNVEKVLNTMSNVFSRQDALLKSQGVVHVYFWLFREAINKDQIKTITRDKLLKFTTAIKENKELAEKDLAQANYDYLTYDRLSQQGTNDVISIAERLRILKEYLNVK